VSVEERLARALREEADGVDVDLHRLHATTRRRLGPAAPRRRRLTLLPALVAGAVLVGTVGVAATVLDRPWDATTATAGRVDERFSCPAQVTADEADRVRDDALLLDLDAGPAAAAASVGAPRFAYSEDGDRALLRLGNADGTLAATATFRRTDGAWVLGTTHRCTGADGGILVPGRGALRLGRHDATPYSATDLGLDPDRAVLVDDRTTYDESGLAQHRSVWAAPCGARLCVQGGTPLGYVIADLRATPAPQDLTSLLLDPDAMVGRRRALVLWGVYDGRGDVEQVQARRDDGRLVDATVLQGPGWDGPLHLVLAASGTVDALLVRHADGRVTTHPAGSITDR
jgi:hypothetical protein